jgi:hypothetical protein
MLVILKYNMTQKKWCTVCGAYKGRVGCWVPCPKCGKKYKETTDYSAIANPTDGIRLKDPFTLEDVSELQ